MTSPDPSIPAPLTADDPRLSEWLDGRLPAAEAADVARAVRESPELTRLVDDLRAIKAAVAGLAAATPVAPEFAARVAAAARHAPAAAEFDPAVEREWRRVEAERIAEERAEAVTMAAKPGGDRPRRTWSWVAIAGALAAGILVTVLANRPREGVREVALAPIGGAGAGAPPADAPAARNADEERTRFAATNAGRAERTDEEAGPEASQPEPAGGLIAAAPAPAAAVPMGEAATGPAPDVQAGDGQAGDGQAGEMADEQTATEVVEVEVLGAEGRAAFDRLLAASGLQVVGGPQAARAIEAGRRGALLAESSADRAPLAEREEVPAPSRILGEQSGAGSRVEGEKAAAPAGEVATPVDELSAGLGEPKAAIGGGQAGAAGNARAVPPGTDAGVLVLQGPQDAIDAFLAGIEPGGVDPDGVGRLRLATGQRLGSGGSQSQFRQQRARQANGAVQQQVERLIEVPAGFPPPAEGRPQPRAEPAQTPTPTPPDASDLPAVPAVSGAAPAAGAPPP